MQRFCTWLLASHCHRQHQIPLLSVQLLRLMDSYGRTVIPQTVVDITLHPRSAVHGFRQTHNDTNPPCGHYRLVSLPESLNSACFSSTAALSPHNSLTLAHLCSVFTVLRFPECHIAENTLYCFSGVASGS